MLFGISSGKGRRSIIKKERIRSARYPEFLGKRNGQYFFLNLKYYLDRRSGGSYKSRREYLV
jgi:hypothetical protein